MQVQNQKILLPEEMQMDMGAVAKGFTGDQVAEILGHLYCYLNDTVKTCPALNFLTV